ncbi:MAG: flagellar basal body rod protein FlgB [Desulfobacterales bacterium]
MILKGFFDETLSRLERSLDRRSRNHQLISSNIANLDTPGYKAFKMVMSDASAGESRRPLGVERTDESHLASRTEAGGAGYRIETSWEDPTLMRGDGNTVDLDREMTDLAENTLMYHAGIRMTSKQFQLIMTAINGSK